MLSNHPRPYSPVLSAPRSPILNTRNLNLTNGNFNLNLRQSLAGASRAVKGVVMGDAGGAAEVLGAGGPVNTGAGSAAANSNCYNTVKSSS